MIKIKIIFIDSDSNDGTKKELERFSINKNFVDINGYPLIAYSIATCKLSDRIDRVIVSTEDEEIASIARFYGAEVPFVRPVEFAKDESTDVDFLLHFFLLVNY